MQPASDLSILLAALTAEARAAYEAAHSFHWRTAGPQFLADHQLFERIYTETYDFIDPLAEKAVGLTGNADLVEAVTQSQMTLAALGNLPPAKDATEFPNSMLAFVIEFLQDVTQVLNTAEAAKSLTPGVENLLQGLADKLESHVYLLRQRVDPPGQVANEPAVTGAERY